MVTGRDVDIKINTKEIYRYLGYRGSAPEEEIAKKIDSCVEEVVEVSELRGLYEKFPLSFSSHDTFLIGDIEIVSEDLGKNLNGCEYVYLMGATIGIGIDRLIARASVSDMTKATIFQAVGAAYVEEYCDYINEEIRRLECREGMALRPRFSPGYGDFTLENQENLFRLLNLSKHVGISLTDSMLMSPSKSVTAIIGVRPMDAEGEEEEDRKPHSGKKKDCSTCNKKDCTFREG